MNACEMTGTKRYINKHGLVDEILTKRLFFDLFLLMEILDESSG